VGSWNPTSPQQKRLGSTSDWCSDPLCELACVLRSCCTQCDEEPIGDRARSLRSIGFSNRFSWFASSICDIDDISFALVVVKVWRRFLYSCEGGLAGERSEWGLALVRVYPRDAQRDAPLRRSAFRPSFMAFVFL
jgi:hypothetical protein